MSVVNVPIANLDSVSDLVDWLASELVANHRFVEKRREGDVAGDDLIVVLNRPESELYASEADLTLLFDCDNTEGALIRAKLQFNVSPLTYEATYQSTTPDAGVIVDWDVAQNEVVAKAGGSFTNWSTAGYSAGQYIRITNAATAANNGLYKIGVISTTTLTNDTIEFTDVVSGGLQDVDTADLADTVTAVEEFASSAAPNGFFNNEDSSAFIWMAGMRTFLETGPYLRARLITNPTSNSATPSEELHFIVILEVTTDVYTQMSFGEAVKLIPFTGGVYFSAGNYDDAVDIDAQGTANWCQGYSMTAVGEANRTGGAPGGIYSTDYTGASLSDDNGRGWLTFGSGGVQPGVREPSHYHAAIWPHFAGNGAEMIGYSPSAFSGQSEAWPLTIFGTFNVRNYNTGSQHAPMAFIPDVFLADITNFDAYSVFEDPFGEKFMVVPFHTKSGSGVGSSEKWGYLIRNPDLVVT